MSQIFAGLFAPKGTPAPVIRRVAETTRAALAQEDLQKLFAASGAWIGLEALPAVLFIASGTALCGVLLAGALGRRMTSTTRLPFGPFLAFGLWAVWLYGSFA